MNLRYADLLHCLEVGSAFCHKIRVSPSLLNGQICDSTLDALGACSKNDSPGVEHRELTEGTHLALKWQNLQGELELCPVNPNAFDTAGKSPPNINTKQRTDLLEPSAHHQNPALQYFQVVNGWLQESIKVFRGIVSWNKTRY